jgi:hypothetical protein
MSPRAITLLRYPGESRDPFSFLLLRARSKWIPAFAGMTAIGLIVDHRGGHGVFVFPQPMSPRAITLLRHPGESRDLFSFLLLRARSKWIPAFAGMTAFGLIEVAGVA